MGVSMTSVVGFGLNRQMKVQLDLSSPVKVSRDQKMAAIRAIGSFAPPEHQRELVQILGLDGELRP